MSKSMPSLVALLGMLAIAGYQNRDKIADALSGLAGGGQPAGGGDTAALPDRSTVNSGLDDLVKTFDQAGHRETADSWVGTGPNRDVQPNVLENVLGGDLIGELAAKTGLSQRELLDRLSQVLPGAVDSLTPGGRLPGN